MNYKKLLQQTAAFIKKRKYYIAVSLCILTIGTVGYISYQNVRNAWDDTPLPEQNTLDATDAAIPKNDVSDEAESVSKPTKEPSEAKAKEYILPVDGSIDVGYSTTTPTYSKTLEDWRVHSGIDYIVPLNTPVKAINDGVVKSIETDTLMGVTVTVKHTDGNTSLYANLSPELTLKVDQLVKQGDIIGKVGKSAIIESAQEPHLHFEISRNGESVDPLSLYDK